MSRESLGTQNRKNNEAARSALAFENAQPLTSSADLPDELTAANLFRFQQNSSAFNQHQPVLPLQHLVSPASISTINRLIPLAPFQARTGEGSKNSRLAIVNITVYLQQQPESHSLSGKKWKKLKHRKN
jgi:hypothetical protein